MSSRSSSNFSQETSPEPLMPVKNTKAPTLAEVARQAGVSKAAASVVLHKSHSQIRVSQATRERIVTAAQELQYQPNTLARALFRKRTDIIGFYSAQGQMFDPLYPFFGTILQGLFRGCEEQEKNLLVHGVFHKRSEEDIFLELLNGQIDGLVLYARDAKTPLIERLVESRLPVITVADEVPGLPCVTVDAHQGGRLLARYLGEKGFRRVFFRIADEVLPVTSEQRIKGFQDEAQRHAMMVTIYRFKNSWPDAQEQELLLSPQQRPEVIVAFNDFTADRLIEFCSQNGLMVPGDIAITGFDGFLPSMRPATRLTTVNAPWAEVARTAVSLLIAQCKGEQVPRLTQLPVTLMPGDTA